MEREFLTNNFEWVPATIADLDRRRGQNEVCRKQIKQTLQLCYSPRSQCHRCAPAGLDGPPALRAAARPSVSARLVASLHPALHPEPRCRLGSFPLARPAGVRGGRAPALADARPARPSVSPRLRVASWGTERELTAGRHSGRSQNSCMEPDQRPPPRPLAVSR